MRKWIKLIENTQVKDATRTKLDIDVAPDSMGDLAPVSPNENLPTDAIPGKKAGRGKARVNFGAASPEAAERLGQLHAAGLQDEIDDAEAARRAGYDDVHVLDTDGAEPQPVENLPAVISTAVQTQDTEVTFEPEWHQVKHLPGYMQQGIRAMGRMVFAPFTDTPIEDIQVLSTLSNPATHVKKMAAWITRNGIRDDAAELRFEEIMPGYRADVVIYNTAGYQFMIVRDFAGHYIYGYEGGRGVHLDAPKPMARLESADSPSDLLRDIATTPRDDLALNYHRFMEGNAGVPEFLGGAGSGQSSSTVKPKAPGETNDTEQSATDASTTASGPAPVLNAAQQAAKARADAQHQKANDK